MRYDPWLNSFFGEMKHKFVEFTSQLKIGLSSVEMIYSVYIFIENGKTCLYDNKTDDVFETNPIPYILLLSRDENLWGFE